MGPATLALCLDIRPPDVLDVCQGGDVKVVVKAIRREKAKGAISLKIEAPPRGISVKRAAILAGKNEAAVSIVAAKQAPAVFGRTSS